MTYSCGFKEQTWQLNACLWGSFFRRSSYLLSWWGVIHVFSFSMLAFFICLFITRNNSMAFFAVEFSQNPTTYLTWSHPVSSFMALQHLLMMPERAAYVAPMTDKYRTLMELNRFHWCLSPEVWPRPCLLPFPLQDLAWWAPLCGRTVLFS